MLGRIIAVAKSAVTRCLCAAGCFIKKALRPAPETVVAGVVQDAVRSKTELVAESRGTSRRPTPARAPEGRAHERP